MFTTMKEMVLLKHMDYVLAFRNHYQFPPSLRNIFKEYNRDLGFDIPNKGNLEKWASQGVLLLNCALTVRQNKVENNFILEASHPSPLSANRGGFFGCKIFSKTNKILESINNKKIDWEL